MLGCEPGVAAITREKGAADVTAWGAHRPDHGPHQDGDDDDLDQYKPGQEEKYGKDKRHGKKLVGPHKNFFFFQTTKPWAFTPYLVRYPSLSYLGQHDGKKVNMLQAD